jgi:hypothetical protein
MSIILLLNFLVTVILTSKHLLWNLFSLGKLFTLCESSHCTSWKSQRHHLPSERQSGGGGLANHTHVLDSETERNDTRQQGWQRLLPGEAVVVGVSGPHPSSFCWASRCLTSSQHVQFQPWLLCLQSAFNYWAAKSGSCCLQIRIFLIFGQLYIQEGKTCSYKEQRTWIFPKHLRVVNRLKNWSQLCLC